LFCIATLGGCDVSSGGPPGKAVPPAATAPATANPTGTPLPSPMPTPAAIVLAPPSLTFASPAAPAQSVAVSEAGYTGTFSVDASACAGIVSAALAANGQSFTVTPIAAGSCTLVVRDTQAHSANLPVTVAP
jgi:hypothetical protein